MIDHACIVKPVGVYQNGFESILGGFYQRVDATESLKMLMNLHTHKIIIFMIVKFNPKFVNEHSIALLKLH